MWVLWVWWGMAALVLLAALLPPVPPAVARDAIAVSGVLALTGGIWWRRPDAEAAWWAIAAGAAVAVAGVSVAAGSLTLPDGWIHTLLWGCSFPLSIAGLALLGRLAGRADAADALDAAMIALAMFLVLFALVIHPALNGDGVAVAAAIIFPVGGLLVLAMVIRVVFMLGVPTVSIGLLLLAQCVFVAAVVSVLVPWLTTGSKQDGLVTDTLWVSYSVLLGAAGLHRSLGHTRPRRRRGEVLSRQRTVLFVILSVVAPIAWGVEIRRATQIGNDPIGFTVPVVVSAVLLILLVTRLALTARVAQQRADQLARRSDQLAEAVEEQAALQHQLRYQAMHDPLTGLSNRLVLTERMEWTLSRPTGSGQHALAMLDLDGFKDVNDTLGHPVGDELLIEAAHRLLDALPRGGTLARLGGDEFAALLEDTPPEQSLAWAEQTRRSLRQPYHVEGQDLYLSSSIGLFTMQPAGPTPTEALRNADLALYAAKAAGKNRVVVFRPEMRAARMNFSRMSTGLRQALDHDELALDYQPVVDLASRRIVAVEALVRWVPEGRTPIDSSDFIPVAEETGMIGPIGAWTLRRACHHAQPWYREHGVAVAVNISGHQLDDPGFADMVVAVLRDANLPGEALILEITESTLVATSATSDAMDQLQRLRHHHVRVAIDAFGTGYSSLAHVARLPADIVKIDRSFVQDQGTPEGDLPSWAFTRAILQLVQTLHLEAVADGVETLEQAEALRQLQCRLAQGYLFAKPMPPQIIDKLVATGSMPDQADNLLTRDNDSTRPGVHHRSV